MTDIKDYFPFIYIIYLIFLYKPLSRFLYTCNKKNEYNYALNDTAFIKAKISYISSRLFINFFAGGGNLNINNTSEFYLPRIG